MPSADPDTITGIADDDTGRSWGWLVLQDLYPPERLAVGIIVLLVLAAAYFEQHSPQDVLAHLTEQLDQEQRQVEAVCVALDDDAGTRTADTTAGDPEPARVSEHDRYREHLEARSAEARSANFQRLLHAMGISDTTCQWDELEEEECRSTLVELLTFDVEGQGGIKRLVRDRLLTASGSDFTTASDVVPPLLVVALRELVMKFDASKGIVAVMMTLSAESESLVEDASSSFGPASGLVRLAMREMLGQLVAASLDESLQWMEQENYVDGVSIARRACELYRDGTDRRRLAAIALRRMILRVGPGDESAHWPLCEGTENSRWCSELFAVGQRTVGHTFIVQPEALDSPVPPVSAGMSDAERDSAISQSAKDIGARAKHCADDCSLDGLLFTSVPYWRASEAGPWAGVERRLAGVQRKVDDIHALLTGPEVSPGLGTDPAAGSGSPAAGQRDGVALLLTMFGVLAEGNPDVRVHRVAGSAQRSAGGKDITGVLERALDGETAQEQLREALCPAESRSGRRHRAQIGSDETFALSRGALEIRVAKQTICEDEPLLLEIASDVLFPSCGEDPFDPKLRGLFRSLNQVLAGLCPEFVVIKGHTDELRTSKECRQKLKVRDNEFLSMRRAAFFRHRLLEVATANAEDDSCKGRWPPDGVDLPSFGVGASEPLHGCEQEPWKKKCQRGETGAHCECRAFNRRISLHVDVGD